MELGAGALEGFEIDLVVASRHGEDPSTGGLLFGMPSAFQRFYTRARKGTLQLYSSRIGRALSTARDLLGLARPDEAHAAGTAVDPDVLIDTLVAAGADLFINETFAGNGRTCATCHPPANNFTIDPVFIAALPDDDPLFVAETNPGSSAPCSTRSR